VAIAQELLNQAVYLFGYQGANPDQAALRRTISTAYYALFHLLIEDAAQRWQGSASAIAGIERTFKHGPMRHISVQFGNPNWKDWRGERHLIPPDLRKVANAFVMLQQRRHTADYDNHFRWTATVVDTILTSARSAFQSWLSIRTHPIAGDYLLAMLLNSRRPYGTAHEG